jgi:hypothetical protein
LFSHLIPLAGKIIVEAESEPVKENEVICIVWHVPPPEKVKKGDL